MVPDVERARTILSESNWSESHLKAQICIVVLIHQVHSSEENGRDGPTKRHCPEQPQRCLPPGLAKCLHNDPSPVKSFRVGVRIY